MSRHGELGEADITADGVDCVRAGGLLSPCWGARWRPVGVCRCRHSVTVAGAGAGQQQGEGQGRCDECAAAVLSACKVALSFSDLTHIYSTHATSQY